MGQIVIRNLDDALLQALRRRASANGRSVEEEARCALTSLVGLTRQAAIARLEEASRIIGPLEGPTSVDDLRRDRSRDG